MEQPCQEPLQDELATELRGVRSRAASGLPSSWGSAPAAGNCWAQGPSLPGAQTRRARWCHVGQLLQVVLTPEHPPGWPSLCQARTACRPASPVVQPSFCLLPFSYWSLVIISYPKLHLSICCQDSINPRQGGKHKLSGPRSAGADVELHSGGRTDSKQMVKQMRHSQCAEHWGEWSGHHGGKGEGDCFVGGWGDPLWAGETCRGRASGQRLRHL